MNKSIELALRKQRADKAEKGSANRERFQKFWEGLQEPSKPKPTPSYLRLVTSEAEEHLDNILQEAESIAQEQEQRDEQELLNAESIPMMAFQIREQVGFHRGLAIEFGNYFLGAPGYHEKELKLIQGLVEGFDKVLNEINFYQKAKYGNQ